MISLRNRAIAGAAVWVSLVIVLGTYLMGGYLRDQTTLWFDDELATRHAQVVVSLANSRGDPLLLEAQLDNPYYIQPFSGQYWQVDNGDTIIASRSLIDSTLVPQSAATTEVQIQSIFGPSGQRLRSTSQLVRLGSGEEWTVQVASSIGPLLRDQEQLTQRLNVGYVSMAAFGTVGAMVLVLATLRPLTRLREEVASRWEAHDRLEIDHYPVEVRPLVEDINELLARNKSIVDRSNRQTADLAHGLKTPAAIMRNELELLASQGHDIRNSLAALDSLDAQLQRSLARIRAVKSGAMQHGGVAVSEALGRMGRAFAGLAKNKDRTLESHIEDGLRAKIDVHDLNEICGNLLDNALKWSQGRMRFSAVMGPRGILIRIADDGPGIPEDMREKVLSGGTRLDETTPGTGLGLAIAADLVAAYDGTLEVGASASLGGSLITICLPGSRALSAVAA